MNKDLAAKDQQAQGAANSAKELQKQLETLQKELEKVKFTSQTMNLKKASGKKKSKVK